MDVPAGIVSGLPKSGSTKLGSPIIYPNSPSTAGEASKLETPEQLKEARREKLNVIHRHGVPDTVCESAEEYEVLRTAAWNDFLNPDCPGNIRLSDCDSPKLRNTKDVQLFGLVHGGIPRHYRRYVWSILLQLEQKQVPTEYFKLCTQALMPDSMYVGQTEALTPRSCGSPAGSTPYGTPAADTPCDAESPDKGVACDGSSPDNEALSVSDSPAKDTAPASEDPPSTERMPIRRTLQSAATTKRPSPLSKSSTEPEPESTVNSAPLKDIPSPEPKPYLRPYPSSAESELHSNPSLLKKLHSAPTPMELQMMEMTQYGTRTPDLAKPSLDGTYSVPSSSPMSRKSGWVSTIQRDLNRTMPGHPLMQDPCNRTSLMRILSAYSVRNPDVGYCQGMNVLAGIALVVMGDEEDAFWSLCAMVEDLLLGYYSGRFPDGRKNLDPVDVDCWILQRLVESKMPVLAEHLHGLSFSVRALAMPWLMAAYAGTLPLDLVLRLWDVMFLQRDTSVLFRAALAMLDYHAEDLMAAEDSAAAYTILMESMPGLHEADPIMIAISSKFSDISQEHLEGLRRAVCSSPPRDQQDTGPTAAEIRAPAVSPAPSEKSGGDPNSSDSATAARLAWFKLCNSMCP